MPRRIAEFRFRTVLALFIVGLVVSGVTAFPLLTEVRIIVRLMHLDENASPSHGSLGFWILTVKSGLETTYAHFPWIAYGTDWLAFGHIVIALFFIGPLLNPAASRSTLLTGIVACALVIPTAMICGSIRGIPFGWRVIDSSFGIIGIVPLLYCLSLLKYLPPQPNLEEIRR